MTFWPLKFQPLNSTNNLLFVDESGTFFLADEDFLDAYSQQKLSPAQLDFLQRLGATFAEVGDLDFMGFAARWAMRLHIPQALNYVILVPTLRCDLDCSYCQVSRVNAAAQGFDWSAATLEAVLTWLDKLTSDHIKIEFQGGEPLLRLDLLQEVRNFCRQRFKHSEFVVCTNLQNVSVDAWNFLSAKDTYISTSFDGTDEFHTLQRTQNLATTHAFRSNLEQALARFGSEHVSALPTIDPLSPPTPEEVIQIYRDFGFRSIYLRRVNHQGFARKRHMAHENTEAWLGYYRRFVMALIQYNSTSSEKMDEYYLTHILKRILQAGNHDHTDLRNPAWMGKNFILIDFNGKFYPTDEARMLTRIGVADLSIGSLQDDLDADKIAQFNHNASNYFDPDCRHCAYQPYCGVDHIDDISRYGRVDLPRMETEHCKLHMGLFDLAFELLYSSDPNIKLSLAHWLDVPEIPLDLIPVAP